MHAQTITIDTSMVLVECSNDTLNFELYLDSTTSTHDYTVEQLPFFQPEDTGGTWLNTVTMNFHYLERTMGFPFYFYCNRYVEVFPYVYGKLGFSVLGSNGIPWTIPSTALNSPKHSILASYKRWDEVSSNLDSVFMQTIGTAPNRKCVITYTNYPLMYCTSLKGKFQFVLHETTNIIDIHLFNIPSCVTQYPLLGKATMGVQNLAGTVATPVPGRNNSYWTAANESWRFTPVGMFYWSNEQGDTIGFDSSLSYVPTKSEWIYANALVCPDTLIKDSAFIIMECYDLAIDSFAPLCIGDSSGTAVASCSDTAFIGPYTWYWTDSLGDTIAIHTTAVPVDTLHNLPSGYYFCRAYDSLMIAASGETWVIEQDTGQAFIFGINLLCFEDSSGAVAVADTQDYVGIDWNGNYVYSWYNDLGTLIQVVNTLDSADTLLNLPAGTYTVVIDACIDKVATVSITQPALLTAAVTETDSTTCSNTCDGVAVAALQGGTAPYSVLWPSAETGTTAIELCRGEDTLWATDSNGCQAFDTFLILSPDSVKLQVSNDTLVCIGNQVMLSAGATGGSGGYDFLWLGTSAAILAQGAAFVPTVSSDTSFWATASDQNGCVGDTAVVNISVRPPLQVSLFALDTLCPADEVTITANAAGGDSLYNYVWSDGKITQSVTRSFSQPQWYAVSVNDDCGTPEASANIWVQVGGYPAISVAISSEDDSLCLGETIAIKATATGGTGGPQSYDYTWRHTSQNKAEVDATPVATETYSVTVTDQCLSAPGEAWMVLWVDTSVAPVIKVDEALFCSRSSFILRVANHRDGNFYRWTVNGMRDSMDRSEPAYRMYFPGPGCQEVGVEQTSAYGCVLEVDTYCLFSLKLRPYAGFYYEPKHLTHREHHVDLRDSSQAATSWAWYLDGALVSNNRNTKVQLPDTGYYEAMQVVYNNLGCSDSAQRVIHKFIEPGVYLPNAFTPNGDGLNDVFRLHTTGMRSTGFQVYIRDRWGQVIYQSTDPDFRWDGTNVAGQLVPIGSYGIEVIYKDYRGRNAHFEGTVQVVR